MTLVIDLGEHLAEVQAFADLAKTFVAKGSVNGLDSLVRSLQSGIAASQAQWKWETPQPIEFGPSARYDGPGREMEEASAHVSFCCVFERPDTVQKKAGDKVWGIKSSAVHVLLKRSDEPKLSCHFDLKNDGQWGPQMHVQLAEADQRFPIPRLPSAVFLPTDCVDLILAELMPERWDRHQRSASSSTHVSVLRKAQESRTLSLLTDIGRQWGKDNGATRVSMLQAYQTGLRGIPNRRGEVPAPKWLQAQA